MGFFPTRIVPARVPSPGLGRAAAIPGSGARTGIFRRSGSLKPAVLTEFTGQPATLVEAGLPLLQGLRVLEEQERSRAMKKVIRGLGYSIESGYTFSEALAFHPRVFNKLYVNMVKAGELGGVLEVVLKRLTEFMEKAQHLKGKVAGAMVYPCAVLFVAVSVVTLLMLFVVPRFKEVFEDLSVRSLPQFTQFVFGISAALLHHL